MPNSNTSSTEPKGIKPGLWLQVLGALFGGALLGVLATPDVGLLPEEIAPLIINWLALPGLIFLAALKMIVVPLVLVAVIAGVTNAGDVLAIRRLGGRVLVYFLITTTIAVTLGTSLAHVVAPGSWVDPGAVQSILVDAQAPAGVVSGPGGWAGVPVMVAGLLPSNPFHALVEGELLQIVIFAALVGAALIAMPKTSASPILKLVDSLQALLMKVVEWILLLTPYAVFGLVAKAVSTLGVNILAGLLGYSLTVLFALVLMAVVYAVILLVFTRTPPSLFWPAVRDAQAVAFATSSSAATMPVTLRVAELGLGLRRSVARFVVPLGTTINMDGTALYQAVATVFLAQVFGIEIGFMGMVMVLTMALAASIGTPGLPGAGVVVLASILLTVGIPPEGVALIIGVDRILDMCRTTLNVTGDLVAATVMNRWEDDRAA